MKKNTIIAIVILLALAAATLLIENVRQKTPTVNQSLDVRPTIAPSTIANTDSVREQTALAQNIQSETKRAWEKLNDSQVDTLAQLEKALPYTSSNVSIVHEPEFDKYLVSLNPANESAGYTELRAFLTEQNALQIYLNDPGVFVVSPRSMKQMQDDLRDARIYEYEEDGNQQNQP